MEIKFNEKVLINDKIPILSENSQEMTYKDIYLTYIHNNIANIYNKEELDFFSKFNKMLELEKVEITAQQAVWIQNWVLASSIKAIVKQKFMSLLNG